METTCLPAFQLSETLVPCAIDSNHWVPPASLTNHEACCKLKQNGYTKAEIACMVPSARHVATEAPHEPPTSVPSESLLEVDLDAFSAAKQKKLRMVEYQPSDGSLSLKELAILRDSKRRRQSYRGVHTARRSYIEILREIIQQQTDLLQNRFLEKRRIHCSETSQPSNSFCSETSTSCPAPEPSDDRKSYPSHTHEEYHPRRLHHRRNSPESPIKTSTDHHHHHVDHHSPDDRYRHFFAHHRYSPSDRSSHSDHRSSRSRPNKHKHKSKHKHSSPKRKHRNRSPS